MTALLVVLGAAVGAPLRFLVDRWAREHTSSGTVLGTLLVNIGGSLVLGVTAGWHGRPTWVLPLVGVGFCGALTTFATLAFEVWVLFEERLWRPMLWNLGLSLGLGGAAVAAGFAVSAAVT